MTPATDRKQETRERVLRAAGAALRQHGPDGIGIADIMRQAGLTHGGFYAHFKSKDDLVAQTLAHVFGRMTARAARLEQGLAPAAALAAQIDRYLSPAHRDNPANGCPLTTLANDIARQSDGARREFDAGMRALVARISGRLPGGPDDALARALLTEMAGAVMLSRAVASPALSDSILAGARVSVRARAGLPHLPPESTHAR